MNRRYMQFKRVSGMWLFALALCVRALGAAAADAHVHGIAVLQVVADRQVVRIDLRAPAHDVLGFEHAPQSAAERQHADGARRHLRTAWYRTPVAAGCRVTQTRVQLPGDEHAASGREGAAHEHREHEGGVHEAHDDVIVSHVLNCRRPEGLTAIEIGLFDAYPALSEIRVQYVNGAVQGERRTTPADRRAALTR